MMTTQRSPIDPGPVDVIVVGAGYAGLTCARALVDAGRSVVVLEARDRVGGRVFTETLPSGVPVDQGGQWVGPGQEHFASLIDETGCTTFPTWVAGEALELRDGLLHRYEGLVPTSDKDGSADTVATLLELDLLAQEVSPVEPWSHPDADRLDRQTFAQWIDATVETPIARALVTTACQAVFGAEPEELSMLFVLSYAHSGGSMSSLIRTSGGAQERRIHQGAQAPALALAGMLGRRVVLSSPVVEIDHGRSGATVSVAGAHPRQFHAGRVVVAAPPSVTGRIGFSPALPGDRMQLIQRTPMGSVTKIHAVYERPFWREMGLNGQLVADRGALRSVFDDSPDDAGVGILVGFVAGSEDRRMEGLGVEGRRSHLLGELASAFGPDAAHPLEFVEQRWSSEAFSGGGPVAGMGPGVLTAVGPALRRPVGVVHWAGTETAEAWSGYIDGAISSGIRAADEVLAALVAPAGTGGS